MQIPEGSQASVAALYRYPVKGLTPEPLESVELKPGETLPFDRAYAIENGPGRFDPEAPRHLPKITFLMLMRDERLATLRSTFDDATQTLTISRGGKPVVSGRLDTPLGRQLIEQFIAAYMKAELRGAPKIVSAPGHSFSDVAAKCVHIVNLASVRELERTVGRKVDPLRFRANVYVDGLRPWAELDWTDKEIAHRPGAASRCSPARSAAPPPTSIRSPPPATWRSPPRCCAPGGTRTSASTRRSSAGGGVAVGAPVAAPLPE